VNLSLIPLSSWLQLALYFIVLIACAKPLGTYMAAVYEGKKTFVHPVLSWLEKGIYDLIGVEKDEESDWKQYAIAVLIFGAVSFVGLYLILRMQGMLPINPAKMAANTPDLAFNTAVSFITNTNWQSYGGESTMSYLSQMVGLTVQNFLSAAVGMAVLAAVIRGFARKNTEKLGNFWVDLTRTNIYILLPLAFVFALAFVSQGMIQTFKPYVDAQLVESTTTTDPNTKKETQVTTQSLAMGPVASQIAIKQLGTNGGGFFNVNSAHPFENPTPFSNLLEMLAILLIPAALCYTFGVMVKDRKQGWALLTAMTVIILPLMVFCIAQEQAGSPKLAALGVDQAASAMQAGGNMEGKETRLGIVNSGIWATATTAASNGSVNSMHDSFTPLGGLVPLTMMGFSEVVFGGVGSGLYGMIAYVIVTVFIAGLMVGRTPEYLGKKINAFDMKMASLAVLVPPFLVLLGTAVALVTEAGKATIFNPYAQGFSEALYAFMSAGNNNGSAFAGLGANNVFYNTALGISMLFSRYFCLIPMLAIAGSLASKNTVPPSAGTLPTTTPLFIGFLVSMVVLVGVLNYVPALALGPVAEHFHMIGKQ
jgi:K+-transporting ATPase ATPase A chain